MCTYNIFTRIISIIVSSLVVLIPLFYIIIYYKKVKKKKRSLKVIFIALTMFLILFGIKNMFKLNIKSFNCLNCLINYKCKQGIKDKNMSSFKEEKASTTNTTKSTTSSSTTTSTSSSTTTTTTKSYKEQPEISGTKKTVGKSSKGYTIYEIDGVTYIDGQMIVNKTYHLPDNFVPTNTYTNAKNHDNQQCPSCIDKVAYKAWKEMKSDAAALNLNIYISSGYRSYKVQDNIYSRNVLKNGQKKADTYSARPGSSEHQSGLCFDLNTIDSSFQYTEEGKWVNNNAYKYGYIIRYPKGKTNETGYIYEPWHLRYVGTELARKLYNNGNWISMEDYFGITSEYKD